MKSKIKKLKNFEFSILHLLRISCFEFRASSAKSQRGFTLVETLVAVAVLLLAIAAPMSLGSQGLTTSRVARDQVIATYLSQEAVEYVRNVRDSNILSGDNWLEGLSDCVSSSCSIDIPRNTIAPCSGACPQLTYHNATGLYGYSTGSGWQRTKFLRTVSIEETVANAEAKLSVVVSWSDGILTRSVRTQEYLMNWQ